MKCKQAEQWIIELSQTGLDPEIKNKLDHHVLHCSKCSAFKKDFDNIQKATHKIKTVTPSAELLEKTIALCQDELAEQKESQAFGKFRPKTTNVPKFVWISFGMLFILTIAWAVPVIKEALETHTITRQSIIVIILMIQNLVMLIFSPVLLRMLNL
ncbi:MAG TPA: hypothetical protein VGD14_16080, partial [bacterium]